MINTDNIMKVVSLPPPIDTPIDVTHNTVKLPILGRVQCVDDSQGRLSVSGVLAYWIYGTFSTYFIILVPAYNDNLIPGFVVYGFLAISSLCLLSLARASFTNPGHIPSASYADETWNLCRTCNRMRPSRAHHCRRCGQCVMRMDHHCPWINNCVGEGNHFAFVQLLFYAFCLSLSALILNLLHFWVFPKCVNCDKEAFHIKHGVWFMYLLFLLALNMTMLMFNMFGQQHFNLILNRTTLESMSKEKKEGRGPQVRTCFNAYRDLCGQGHPLLWWWPLGRRRPALLNQFQQTV